MSITYTLPKDQADFIKVYVNGLVREIMKPHQLAHNRPELRLYTRRAKVFNCEIAKAFLVARDEALEAGLIDC